MLLLLLHCSLSDDLAEQKVTIWLHQPNAQKSIVNTAQWIWGLCLWYTSNITSHWAELCVEEEICMLFLWIIHNNEINFHCYADDSPLYLPVESDDLSQIKAGNLILGAFFFFLLNCLTMQLEKLGWVLFLSLFNQSRLLFDASYTFSGPYVYCHLSLVLIWPFLFGYKWLFDGDLLVEE